MKNAELRSILIAANKTNCSLHEFVGVLGRTLQLGLALAGEFASDPFAGFSRK